MFDNVREWLRKGRFEKVIGFGVLFLAVYGIIWGIVEPLISADFVEKYFPNALKHWWKLQLILSGFFSIMIYIWLYPKKIIQSFGTEINDTRLDAGSIIKGNPSVEVNNDGYYGDIFFIRGDAKTDAIDWQVSAMADNDSSVSYIYQPINKFILYLSISLISKNRKKEKNGWLALRTDISLPLGAKGQEEWAYPVKGRDAKNGWLVSHINISKAVSGTFGHEGWQFNKLKGIRIRGEGKIQKISLRGGYS